MWFSSPVPGTEFLNPWEFPGWWEHLLFSWGHFCLVPGQLHHGPLTRERLNPTEKLGTLHSTLHPLGRRLEVINNWPYLHDEASVEIPKWGGLASLWVGEHIHPNSTMTEACWARSPSRPHPVKPIRRLLTCILCQILYVSLSSASCHITPNLQTIQIEIWMRWGSTACYGCEVGALRIWVLNPWGLHELQMVNAMIQL